MKKWTLFALISIFLLAITLRLMQLLNFSVWGSDTGEYYYLTEQLASSGRISFEYDGWGFGYPYFPAMFIMLSGFANLTGLSTFTVTLFVVPIISAFSVFLIFIITKRLLKNLDYIRNNHSFGGSATEDLIGLLAAGFFAVALPHVFTTSHPMPGALGDFLMLLCILLLLKSYENRKFMVPLVLCSVVLIFTHHLSTFFLFVIVIFITLVREITLIPDDAGRTKIDLGYITFLLTGMLLYWCLIAVPFTERVVLSALGFTNMGILFLTYIGLIMIWAIIRFRRRLKWRFKLTLRNFRVLALRFTLFLIISFSLLSIVVTYGVPGTELEVDPITLLALSPLLIFTAFGTLGQTFARNNRDGMFLAAWLIACVILMGGTMITNSREIPVYRLFQYLAAPLSIIVGIGCVYFFKLLERGEFRQKLVFDAEQPKLAKKPAPQRHVRATALCIVLILITAGALFSYPPRGVLSGFQEGTSQTELEGCLWVRESLEPDAVVASDHRMSSMLFGFGGVNATWETAPDTLHAETVQEISGELNSTKTPSGEKAINYVLLTDELKEGVTLKQWEPAEPMSDEAVEKFRNEPFYKIYDNGDVEIYLIDWM